MADHNIDFPSLILGLSSAALSYLGLGREDTAPSISKADLDLAAQNIEIIALLEEKTKGNLTPEEVRLTQQVLSDLRMKFVEAQKKLV